MTEPSQYFKGRTVQEQMDEVIGYVDVRSAEVATAAIASDVAQVHQDMLDADADASAAAASAAAAAGTLANAVKKTGEASQSIAGNIAVSGDLTGGTVTVPAPVNNTDAASKKYVDDQDALDVKITDINSYAVGLTGNQDDIKGRKCFDNLLSRQPQTRLGNTGAAKICGVPATASTVYTFNVIVSTRYSVDIYHMSVTLDAGTAITSVTADSISTAATKNTRIGAYIDGAQMIITARPTTNNTNVSGIILNCCYSSGLAISTFDYSMNSENILIANEPSYVEES